MNARVFETERPAPVRAVPAVCQVCGTARSRLDPHLVFATAIVATVDGATGARVGLRSCAECRTVFTEELPE